MSLMLGFLHATLGLQHNPPLGYMVSTKDPCWCCRVIDRWWNR